ncbi:Ig-like domain-containing protein [Gemmatimonas sp.]|uniref:Ig-like domain-containing protein n=1 Tax=Gemmatimonas sp. TaxID=1962908 RepID=UPI003DA4213F
MSALFPNRSRAVVASVAGLMLGACKPPEAPPRSTDATVNVSVPDVRTLTPRIDATSAEVLVGQTRGGAFTSFGRVSVTSAQFGQRVSVPVKLTCGTEMGCTVNARLRLLADGTPFDSSDTPSFAITGGESRETGGFAFRPVRRLVAAETLTVAVINSTRQLVVRVLDDADHVLPRRAVTWESGDRTVATVDSLGRVTALRGGRTAVTASIGAARASVNVAVNAVQSFTVTASAARVVATVPVQLTAQLAVGPGVSNRVRYRSSDTTVATVSDAGAVRTLRAGTVTMTAIAEADTLERRTVSIIVDPFRAASTYTGVSVLSRGDVPGNLGGIWGERFENLFAAGCAGLMRWNGSSWRLEQTLPFCANGVAGTDENNVIVVGQQIWRWNGTVWARETVTYTGELLGAVAVEGVVYAVGTGGQILRRTTSGWSAMTSPTSRTLRGVHGVFGSNVWAVGDAGVMLRFNGTAWQTMNEADGQFLDCRAVHVRGPTDVMATCNERNWGWSIQRWNGTNWTRMNTPQREFMTDIAETNGIVYAVGSQRTAYRLVGNDWVQDADRLGDQFVTGIYADARGIMAVGNEGFTMRRTSTGWTILSGYPLYDAMWAGGPDLIVAAGTRGAIDLFDGTRWTSSRPQGETNGIRDVWGASRDAIFAVGPQATMLRYDGARWQTQAVPTTAWINGVWGLRRDSVWAVTGNGEILFYDGQQWALKFRTGRNLLDIHGRDVNNIVVVGDEGRIWRFDGRTWQREESGTDASLNAVFVGQTRTFAVSGNQIFSNRDGEWQPAVVIAGSNFNWLTGTGDSDVYVGGCGAQTRRFDGTTWVAEVPTNFSQCTFSGFALPGGGLIIGGAQRDIISGTGPTGATPGR